MNPEEIRAALIAAEAEIKQMAESGNQGAAYLRLFQITGNANWLITGQVSTFSGTFGGIALGTNLDLQRQMGAAYPGIGFISTRVAVDEVNRFYDQLYGSTQSYAWTFSQKE